MADTLTLRCAACGALNRVDERRLKALPVCGKCGRPLASSQEPVHVTADSFEKEVMRFPGTVLVDFWAPWCGPCRAIAPVLEDLAKRRAGAVKVVKINTDEEPGLAARFGIMSIPTLVLFHAGGKVNQLSGALPLSRLEAWIDSSLSKV